MRTTSKHCFGCGCRKLNSFDILNRDSILMFYLAGGTCPSVIRKRDGCGTGGKKKFVVQKSHHPNTGNYSKALPRQDGIKQQQITRIPSNSLIMKVILDDASNHAKNGKKKEGIGTQDPDSEHEVDVVLAFGGKVLKVKTDVMVSQQMS